MTVVINGTTGITNDGGYTGDGVVFADTTPANTLVTTTGGNVGIGTSSPRNPGAGYQGLTLNGSTSGFLDVNTNGTRVFTLFGNGNDVIFAGAAAGAMSFQTNGAERTRIDSGGNLLVNTTSVNYSYTPDAVQILAGGYIIISHTATTPYNSLVFNNGNGQVGNVTTSGSSTTFATSSDYRLKEAVQPMTGALARLSALKPVTYKWKVDGSDGEGFIAHELAEVVPDAVTGEKDAVDAEGNPRYQGIDTSFLVATLTAAIQELKAIVDAQGAEIAALKGTDA